MTHHTSRKKFFGKLLGVAAAATVAPKLFANSVPGASPASTPARSPSTGRAFELRHDARAVVRRDTV
ncbi:MAG: hypothetical protein EXS37_05750 [Opitutus sp.]|nr:hypothetical protein [Opitutus sp.]